MAQCCPQAVLIGTGQAVLVSALPILLRTCLSTHHVSHAASFVGTTASRDARPRKEHTAGALLERRRCLQAHADPQHATQSSLQSLQTDICYNLTDMLPAHTPDPSNICLITIIHSCFHAHVTPSLKYHENCLHNPTSIPFNLPQKPNNLPAEDNNVNSGPIHLRLLPSLSSDRQIHRSRPKRCFRRILGLCQHSTAR